MGPAHRRERAFAIAGLLAFGLGAYVSLQYSRGLWHPDPDIAIPYVVWQGVRRHGLAFVTRWAYTPDNWLLSLFPLDVLLATLAPGHPGVIVLSGWLVFLLDCALAGVLLAAAGGGRRAAVWLAAALAFANVQALGAAGFLSYPVTHNISVAWGLGAIWLSARALKASGVWRVGGWLAAAGAALVVDGLSDPWSLAAFTLPLVLAGAVLAVQRWGKPDGRAGLALALAGLAAFVVSRTRAFGLVGFLPPSPLALATPEGVAQNAGWMFRALAAMGNLAPGTGETFTPGLVVSGVMVIAGLAAAAALALRLSRRAPGAERLVLLTAAASLGLVAGAFLAGQWPQGLFDGRYFGNAYFLGGVLAAWTLRRLWPDAGGLLRAGLAGLAVLFVAAGLASAPGRWLGRTPPRGEAEVRNLAGFLQAQGLHYGYGPYWGSYALSMEWITRGDVVVRPVTFAAGRVARRGTETSPFWYDGSDEPAAPERFLVVANDGEECPDPDRCVAEAVAQFGPPARTLAYGPLRVLVWRGPLFGRLGR